MCVHFIPWRPPCGTEQVAGEWEVQVAWFRKGKAAAVSPWEGVKGQLQAGKGPMTTELPAAGMHEERQTGCCRLTGLWRASSELASLRFPSWSWNLGTSSPISPSFTGLTQLGNSAWLCGYDLCSTSRPGSLFSLWGFQCQFPTTSSGLLISSSLSSPFIQKGRRTINWQPENRASALWAHFLALEMSGSPKSFLSTSFKWYTLTQMRKLRLREAK